MFDILVERLKEWFSSRFWLVALFYLGLSGTLIYQLFSIQIMGSADIKQAEKYRTVQERKTSSTRGLIYDRNGVLLAYNELSYSVILEDSPLLNTNDKKNAMLYRLIKLLEKYGIELETEFYIEQNEQGELQFTVSDTAELRFKKNALGKRSIENLTEEEAALTAQELFDILRYGTRQLGSMYGISDEYNIEDTLNIMAIRYAIFTMWPKYSQITIATDIPENVVAAMKESSGELPGISVVMQTHRVYDYSEYFAHIIGYTGLINESELELYNAEETVYSSTDAIGKTGIEKEMESVLAGTKGVEQLTLDSNYRILETNVVSDPVAGDNVYLTIDAELQKAYYHLLEQYLAEILLKQMTSAMDYGTKGESADDIKIPIYEVYNALIANNVLNITHFASEDATELEQKVHGYFLKKQETVLTKLREYLQYGSTVLNSQVSEEMAEYLDYIYSKLTSSDVNLLPAANIDKSDLTYQAYMRDEISLSEFLVYAINHNWMNLERLNIGKEYNITDEIYQTLMDYTFDMLLRDTNFAKKLYRALIFNYQLSGKEICLLLFDQDVLKYKEQDVTRLRNGVISPYNFMREKIQNLEITPAQLALEPCSASVVVTDPRNGDTIALVTYPSYDNNKLANKIDWDYYSALLADKSNPLSSRATSSKTTTGSTFKMLSSLAGIGEGVIGVYEKIKDDGVFEKVDPSPKCWYYPYRHGNLDIPHALLHSCNYYYFEVGYRLSMDENGKYSDSLGISKITKYAEMFGLGANSGLEVAELTPYISTTDAVRTAIGYYHSFTPSQIARYATTLANRGTCYNLTLIDRIIDKNDNLVRDNEATIFNEITEFSNEAWNQVQSGMHLVLDNNDSTGRKYDALPVEVAGKSGTAQVSNTRPSHALFVSYAPYEAPELCVTIVIPNGYTSNYAVNFGYIVYDYYYNRDLYTEDYKKIEPGEVTQN